MKNTQNGSRHWISFGTVKRCGIRVAIGAALTLSVTGCVPIGDRCLATDEEKERIVWVWVDDELPFSTIQTSGECTALVEFEPIDRDRRWETKMTGPVGSTCTVRLDLGDEILEQTANLVPDNGCGYPGASNGVPGPCQIMFLKKK